MSTKTITTTQTTSKFSLNSKKKKILLSVVAALITLIAFTGYQAYAFQKAMQQNRAAMEKQRQVLIDHFKAEGLTDAEIQQKLREQLQLQRTDFNPPWYFSIMRTFRQATGTGPRLNGNQRFEGGMPPEGAPGRVAGQSSKNDTNK